MVRKLKPKYNFFGNLLSRGGFYLNRTMRKYEKNTLSFNHRASLFYSISMIFCTRVGFYEGNKTCFWILYFCLDFQNFGPFFSEFTQNWSKCPKSGKSRQKSKIQKTSFVPLIKPNSHAKNHGN